MSPLQRQIMYELGVKSEIEPKKEIRNRVDFLKNYLTKTNMKGFVLGISGGQDSTLAGKLAQIAIDELNKEKCNKKFEFLALKLPYGSQNDKDDVNLTLTFINPDRVIDFNIKESIDKLNENYKSICYNEFSDYTKSNIKARMRMLIQYAFASEDNLLVIGTNNAAEEVTGFYTKYGDGAADILPLSGLTKRQVKMLLKELGTPSRLYDKVPIAGLSDENPERTDEDELGISYKEIDDYLEGEKVSEGTAKKIERMYMISHHKRELPTRIDDNWWL